MYISCFRFSHLSHVRKYFGLTQFQLGQLLGVSKNTVSDWENGSQPSLTHFLSICDLFSLPLQFFLDDTDFSFDDISFVLDIYYSSFSAFGESLYQDLFSRFPVSSMLRIISDEGNIDDFSWVSDGAIVKKLRFTFNVFDLSMKDYTVPPRFSHLYQLMLFGGVQDA